MLTRHLLYVVCLLCVLAGCVERKLSIKSDPPNADVYIDGEKVGETPCEITFTFYGTRQITIEKDGYNTISKMVEIPAPPYEIFPADFIFEVLVPARISDTKNFNYVLVEEVIEESDEKAIFQRAKALKNHALEDDK